MKHFQILSFLAILLLHSCKCDEEVSCVGVNSIIVEKIPHQDQGQILFTNGIDSSLIFNRISFNQDGPEIKECMDASISGCNCPACDDAKVSNIYRLDDDLVFLIEAERKVTWKDTVNGVQVYLDSIRLDTLSFNYGFYNISSYNAGNEDLFGDEYFISYQFLDCPFWYKYERNEGDIFELVLGSKDSLLSSFDTPKNSYEEVIKTRFSERFSGITSVYTSTTIGVVAFKDSSNVLYYRD